MRDVIVVTLVVLCSSGVARAQMPAAIDFVESESLPVRVYFNIEENRALAEQALPEAEAAWMSQVEVMGFEAPYTVDDDMNPVVGARFYITTSEQFYGYAQPMAGIDSTARTDCATVVMLSDAVPGWYLPSLMQHEFNHAIQESIDCVESPFAYEQITVAVTQLLEPDAMFATFVAGYQETPHRALYHTDHYDNYYYHYGASLFSYFLEHRYGEGNGRLLARIWSATPQDGVIDFSSGWADSDAVNEPDLLDAMTTVLAEEGVAFDDAFAAFAESRYFIGAFDDGKHLPGAGDWGGAELSMDTHYDAVDLPVMFEAPRFAPEELGVSAIAFDLFGLEGDEALRLAFSGDADTLWRVSAIVHSAVVPMELAEDGSGSIVLAGLGDEARAVLLVVNLGDGEYDSDEPATTSDYVYSAALLDCGALEVGSVEPGAIEVGSSATVTLAGRGFPADQTIDVQISGDGAVVSRVVRRSDSLLDVHLDVAEEAATGARDLTVSIECGATAVAALRIEDASGCTAAPPGAWLVIVGLAALMQRRRARKAPPTPSSPSR